MDLNGQSVLYFTANGHQVVGDSRIVMDSLPDDSVDLIITSPPFALLRQKAYGNEEQDEYVEWLCSFGRAAFRILKKAGSCVIDLGGSYQRGRPVRSLHNFRVLLRFCDDLGFRLAEEFFWYNPAKLPSPIEWVNKRKIRAKDSVNTIWWFSKSDEPKADVTKVLTPYSDRMKLLLKKPESYYRPKGRPSGHAVSASFARDNGGSIPSNLLTISNTESNSHYLRTCSALNRHSHPARFPEELPAFFIKMLTDPGDLVVDIFSGSNTTGFVAERLDRRWLSIDNNKEYAALSSVRFLSGLDIPKIASIIQSIESGNNFDLRSAMPNSLFIELPEVIVS